MKKLKTFHIMLVLLLVITCSGQLSAQGSLQVTVTGIKEVKGSIRVGLFNTENTFLKEALHGKVVKVEGSEVTVTFEKLKPGDYAISVIHDENDNGELDSNMIGMPKEGFAFGNNAMGMFGPPSFDKAKVVIINESISQSIALKYL